MTDVTVPLAALGLVSAILALVVTPLFSLLKANTKALEKVAKSSEKVATATQKSAKEAKQRNGHLGEQSKMIADLVTQGNETHHEILERLNKSAVVLADNTKAVAKEAHLVADALKHQNDLAE